MLKEALHVFCPVLHIFWRERGEPNKPPSQERRLCSHSKATLSENENHLVTTPRLHWWSATAEAKQHIQRWAVMFSLFFFFFPKVWSSANYFILNFSLQNWRTSGLLHSSAFQLKDMFHFNFHSKACDSFLQELFQMRHVLHIVCNAVY